MNAKLAQFGSRAVLLSAGIALTVSATVMATGSVDAKPRAPRDAGTRCMYTDSDGYNDFFMPGESHTVGVANYQANTVTYYTLVCNPAGQWELFGVVTS
jgi:hypothetical protein